MTAVAAAPAEDALSFSVKTLYAADIFALQHRLHRCLHAAGPLLSSGPAAKCANTARHVRRLGDLLREATVLCSRIEGHDASKEALSSSPPCPVEDTTADESLRAFYDQQLQVRFCQLQADMAAAHNILRGYVSSTPALRGLPVNCIGTTPRQLQLHLESFPTETCFVFSDALPPAAARLPPPVLHHIPNESEAPRQPFRPTTEKPAPRTATDDSASGAVPTPSATPSSASAEDRIMADIQQAIHQMKDGALQMSAMMAQEKTQMQSAADLLSSGVAKSQTNLNELERVSYVAASGKVPRVLSFIPGMPILWRTVLQPMWALVKQVLLMAAILAVTGCVLVVIAAVPKPVLFRGQRKAPLASPASPPSTRQPALDTSSLYEAVRSPTPGATYTAPPSPPPPHSTGLRTASPTAAGGAPEEEDVWAEPGTPVAAGGTPEEEDVWAEPDTPVAAGGAVEEEARPKEGSTAVLDPPPEAMDDGEDL